MFDGHNAASSNHTLLWLVLKLLPEKYQIQKENLYERLMHISHFVSLLTDGKAMELNHILSSQER